MGKPSIIVKLESTFKEKIPEVDIKNILKDRGYSIDSQEAVIGLNLDGLNITDLSPIAPLNSLETLWLCNNNITDLSPLVSLIALKELYLFKNQVNDPSPLVLLKTLKELYLQYNEITNIAPLASLKTLNKLSLGNNLVNDISPLASLNDLEELHLYKNQLTDLSPLSSLTSLTYLNLSQNRISDLSHLTPLNRLNRLELSENQISDLSPLSSLTSLERLWLSNNKITDLFPIVSLTALTRLELGGNHISDLSSLHPLLKSKQLVKLDLTDNKITFFSKDFINTGLRLKWEHSHIEGGIFLAGNPLESPPIEIVKLGHDAVVNYFKQLEKSQARLLHCKLLIIGNGEVGKTTLMKKLKDPSFQVEPGKEATTHGINITPWEQEIPCPFDSEKHDIVKISFWDFGGQDIYHGTHQFFLSKNSLYLLVWEARKEEDTRSFEYWLNVIKLLGSSSPVIVVMNKSDIRIKSIDEATLKEKFPNIVGFLHVSCLNGNGFQELTDYICKALSNMSHLQDLVPAVWIHIRNELKVLKEKYISSDRYFAVCQKHGLNREDARYLGDYLHNLGIILHFKDDPGLADTVILDPEWATKSIYALIDTREIIKNKGSFYIHDLSKYLDPLLYPENKHLQIVRLMEKFELCFNFLDTDRYFIPELLPGDPLLFDRSGYRQPEILHFQYYYEFMPEGILSRFISRLYYLIDQYRFWKYGVELRFETSTALVLSEPINRKIKIVVTGKWKSELLAIIRTNFNHIHSTLDMINGLDFKEMVPCKCQTCIGDSKRYSPNLFSYDTLKKYINKGRATITCNESVEEVEIDSLLKGIEPSKPKKDIVNAVIDAAVQLQGLSGAMKSDEDSRTSFLTVLLKTRGFIVNDQSRWGISESGKSTGRLDGKIESEEGIVAVLEAFKLDHLDRTVIESHCKKIFNYDPNGLPRNFIVVYSESKDFSGLWDRYKEHLKKISYEHPKEESSGFAEIKVACARHQREKAEVAIYHVFINMKPKQMTG